MPVLWKGGCYSSHPGSDLENVSKTWVFFLKLNKLQICLNLLEKSLVERFNFVQFECSKAVMHRSEAYLEPFQTSKMQCSAKIRND